MSDYQIKTISRSQLAVTLDRPYWPHLWTLSQGIEYVWRWDLGEERLYIPNGYSCDGASIPFRFYDLVDPINALPGAFLHDLLYETCAGVRKYRLIDGTEQELITSFSNRPDAERRSRSDALLQSFWLYDNMPSKQVRLGYSAVRLFGHGPWADEEPKPSNQPLIEKMIGELEQ